MQVISTGADLFDRFAFVVDERAEPVDFDEALATFLLAYIEHEPATSSKASTARVIDGLGPPPIE